jgi:hypothetical protein
MPIDEPAAVERQEQKPACVVIPMEKDAQKAAERLGALMENRSLSKQARREMGKELIQMAFAQAGSLAKIPDAKRVRFMCTLASALR